MKKKIDNWALILGLIGSLSIFFMILIYFKISPLLLSKLIRIPDLIGLAGFVVGIIALVKGSNQKWKPILAISIYVLRTIITIIGILVVFSSANIH